MSLVKSSLVAGGASLQTYLKDGNNIHTESVAEWILLEDRDLVAATNYFWRLSDREFNIQLVSLWGTTTGNITIKLQNRGVDVFSLIVSGIQASTGYLFPTLIVPSGYDIVIVPVAAVTRLFVTAKEISICERIALTKP